MKRQNPDELGEAERYVRTHPDDVQGIMRLVILLARNDLPIPLGLLVALVRDDPSSEERWTHLLAEAYLQNKYVVVPSRRYDVSYDPTGRSGVASPIVVAKWEDDLPSPVVVGSAPTAYYESEIPWRNIIEMAETGVLVTRCGRPNIRPHPDSSLIHSPVSLAAENIMLINIPGSTGLREGWRGQGPPPTVSGPGAQVLEGSIGDWLRRPNPDEEACGDCFEAAFNWVMDNCILGPMKDACDEVRLVHGEVTGQGELEGIKYGHAWVEIGDAVIDTSNNRTVVMRKSEYYRIARIPRKPNVYKYTVDAARMKILTHQHYGPWDLETESGL